MPDAAAMASALSGGHAPRLVAEADVEFQARFAELLSAAYADALRDVFLVSGSSGLLGALLVLFIVPTRSVFESVLP